jgi:pimeloyl-ACP methyl ester carboxylesterase
VTTRTVERDGVRLYVEVHGDDPDHVPLLLTHGFGASTTMWKGNIGALSRDRAVITWDVRGHGQTVTPLDPSLYTHDACVADMVAILDDLGITRAVVAGLSLGGYLSLCFHLAHPSRVAALALFDTGPGFKNDDARASWNDYARHSADDLESRGADALRASPEVDRTAASPLALALAARGILAQHDARVISSLPIITVPTMVLVGSEDTAFLNGAAYMASRISGATYRVLANAGHAANIDQPAAFNDAVGDFLLVVDRTGAS